MKQTAVEWLIEHLLDNGVGIHKKVRETALELEQIQKMELLNVSKGSDADELLEHYEFYLDNLQDNEIPLSFEFWKNEYKDDLIKIIKSLKN